MSLLFKKTNRNLFREIANTHCEIRSVFTRNCQHEALKQRSETPPSLYWYFLSVAVGSGGFGWMFSASNLSSLSSQVRSDSSGAGGEAAGGWVSGARVGAGSCSGEATTCSWLKYWKNLSLHNKGFMWRLDGNDKNHKNETINALFNLTSLKASKRSPASFLFRSFIFLFFFGTDTAATGRHNQQNKADEKKNCNDRVMALLPPTNQMQTDLKRRNPCIKWVDCKAFLVKKYSSR